MSSTDEQQPVSTGDGDGEPKEDSSPGGLFLDRSAVIQPALAAYFNTRTFSDLTVLAPDGRRLLCHQVVLSAGSKKFAKILEQPGLLQAEPELPVWGVDSDALEAVLRCFYTGECRVEAGNVIPIMDAAQRLEVLPLAAFCETYVTEALAPGTCCQLLAAAGHFRMPEVCQQALAFAESCFTDVTSSEGFLSASPDVVARLLEHTRQKVPAVIHLRAGWEWLVADPDHEGALEDIASLLELPDGLQPPDLLQRSAAAQHGITWRLPQPPETQEEEEDDPGGNGAPAQGTDVAADEEDGDAPSAPPPPPPAPLIVLPELGPDGLPSMEALEKAGLLPQLPGLPPLPVMGLPGGDASLDAVTLPLAADLPGPPGGWTPELLAQLSSPAFGGLGVAGLTPPPSILGAGGGEAGGSVVTGGDSRGGGAATATTGGEDSPAPAPAPPRRPSTGRGGGARGVCQVEGCNTDLGGLRDYHQRYKICEYHLKIPSVMKEGVPQRFCQQCGRFQPLTEFEGQKRSCRARLQRHNDRRRKRLEEEPSGGYHSKRTAAREAASVGEDGSQLGSGSTRGGTKSVGASTTAPATPLWPPAALGQLQLLTELMSRVNGAGVVGALQQGLSAVGAGVAVASAAAGTPSPAPGDNASPAVGVAGGPGSS